MEQNLSVRLAAETRGELTTYIDAAITADGDLRISGQDLGPAASMIGGDETEYTASVDKEHKDDLLRALLEALYSGSRAAIDDFLEFASQKGVPATRLDQPGLAPGEDEELRIAEDCVVTVRTADKDQLLLALIEKIYAGNTDAVYEFRDFAQSKGIPVGWFRWP